MRKLLIQPQAKLDLLEIWHYIARDSIESANRVGSKIDAEIRDLLEMPGKGHTRTDGNPGDFASGGCIPTLSPADSTKTR